MQKIINQNLISYKTVIRTYDKTTPDNKDILIRQKEIIITDVKTTQKNIFLPDEIDGCPIIDIGDSAFENNDSIERVTLPKQLKNIRNNAFKNCKNLKSVDIPTVEVHLSDIYQREEYRHISYIKEASIKSIVGLGFEGYKLALETLNLLLKGK